MTQQWSLPAYAVLLVAVLVLAAVAALAVALGLLARSRAHRDGAERRLARAEAEAADLRETVAGIARRLDGAGSPEGEAPALPDYVITRVGDPAPDAPDEASGTVPARLVPAPLFADLVLRESVVQAASLAAGVRRALAPRTRARIRVEMRQEVKRARKQRRHDLRAARRAWEARERHEGSAA